VRKNMQGTTSDIQVSLEGALVIAERTGKYAGLLGPFWCGKAGKWQDAWLDEDTPPAAAKVGVLRTDCREPFWAIADFDRYCRRGPDGKPQGPWRTMAHLMLARCAKLQALRRAFPEELEGLQTAAHADEAEA
jgi:phage recombination protein Bet